MKDDRERLFHILEAMERIEKYAAKGEKAFRDEELIQNWIIRNIQVIGEAARALSGEFREKHPQIPWSDIIAMRNVLVHDYFDIDLDIVWQVVIRDLPQLKSDLQNVLKKNSIDSGQ